MSDNKKISELQEDTALTLADFVPIVSPGSLLTKKANLARILSLGGYTSGGPAGGSGTMLDTFTINIPGDPFKANGHTVNIGDSLSSLLKLILAPAVSAVISAGAGQTVALQNNLTIALTATETPGSNPIVTRLWSQLSGPVTLTITNPGQANATLSGFTPASAGTYQLKYHTVDSEGTVVDSLVTELITYAPPVISVSPVNIQLPVTSGNLSAAVSITAGSYALQSTVYSLVTGSGVVNGSGAFSGFNTAGSYTCNVLVTDVNGHTASMNIPVNVAAAPFNVLVDYAFMDHDAYAELQTGDSLTYTGQYSIPADNADWALDWHTAPANTFPVLRVPEGQTPKNRYTDSGNPTFGTDTFDDNSSSARRFTARGYDYYTFYAPVNFTTAADSRVNFTIN